MIMFVQKPVIFNAIQIFQIVLEIAPLKKGRLSLNICPTPQKSYFIFLTINPSSEGSEIRIRLQLHRISS